MPYKGTQHWKMEGMDALIYEGKRLYNDVLALLRLPERTPEETRMMLHKAHACCYLLRSRAASPADIARGEWQVSRVYSVAEAGALALLHGEASLGVCLDNDIDGMALAFAYGAVARGCLMTGDRNRAAAMRDAGLKVCERIRDVKDKAYTLSELCRLEV